MKVVSSILPKLTVIATSLAEKEVQIDHLGPTNKYVPFVKGKHIVKIGSVDPEIIGL